MPASLAVGVEEQDFDEMAGQPAGERLQVVRRPAAHLQRRAGGWITLRIEDDGPGMSEDQIVNMGGAGGCGSTRRCRVPGWASTSSPISRKPTAAALIAGAAELGITLLCRCPRSPGSRVGRVRHQGPQPPPALARDGSPAR